MSQHEHTEALHEALHSAVARAAAEHADYQLPEATVRARARRRRAWRAAGAASLSLALVAGAGVALANLGGQGGRNVDPHASETSTSQVSPEAVCSWQGSGAQPDSSATLAAGTGDLAISTGRESLYRVSLSNGTDVALRLPSGSAPVLFATADGESEAVLGYAIFEGTPGPDSVPARGAHEYEGFSAFKACPGAPTWLDDEHLAPGRYDLFVGQAIGAAGVDAAAPFSTWAPMGSLWLAEPPPRTPEPEPELPPGQCGSWASDAAWGSQMYVHFEEPLPTVALVGEPFDPRAAMTSTAEAFLKDAIQGGPILLVSGEDGTVLARSTPVDPLPAEGLEPGETVSFGRFGPLVDCTTGEPLAPGKYDYVLAQLKKDSDELTGTGALFGELVITSDTEIEYEPQRLLELPRCGASIDGFAFDPSLDRAGVTWAGYTEQGYAEIDVEYTYTGPDLVAYPWGHRVALVRDGVVVSRATIRYDAPSDLKVESGSVQEGSFFGGWDCAAGEEQAVSFRPSGEYTAIGFMVWEYRDELDLPRYALAVLDPTTVDFGTPPAGEE